MKSLFLLLLFISFEAYSSNKLFICLGKEESIFHKDKDTGPFYHLNQQLISDFLQLGPEARLKESYVESVCKDKKPAFKLLEFLLLEGNQIFKILADKETPEYLVAEGSIRGVEKSSIRALRVLIGQIQALAPTHKCLQDNIPSLKKFIEETLYLEQDIEQVSLFKNKREMKYLLKQLKNYQDLFGNCVKEKPKGA